MDLSSLNKQQLAAVTAPMGPVLVLAGAGSGKTRVLTYRLAYLIEQKLIAPEHILALTFTNKAAKEMQTRILKLLAAVNSPGSLAVGLPTLGTFHSVCARILRKEIGVLGYSSDFSIFDGTDQLKVIREVCDELGVGKKFPPTVFRSIISRAKNVLQTPGEFNLGYDPSFHDLAVSVYTAYQNFLYEQNAVDFDDLLMLPIRIFQAFPKVLVKYQTLFQYILVDEYQDTNQAQYVFLHLLSQNHSNLFVVGDDAQSIYGFRGSDIANILNFEKDYEKVLVIKLEQNYRSTKNILAVAQNVIDLNQEQKPKTLWTNNEAGKRIWVEEVGDGREEAIFIARQIVKEVSSEDDGAGSDDIGEPQYEPEPEPEQEPSTSFSILDQFLKKQGANRGVRSSWNNLPQLPRFNREGLHNFAVLYRTNAQSRELEEIFIQCGIPYQIVGGVKFYERKEIKDILAYARLTVNFTDLVSLKRVINVPARGIGEKSYTTIKNFVSDFRKANPRGEIPDLAQFQAALAEIPLPPKQKQAVQDFFGIFSTARSLPEDATISDALRLLLQLSKLEDWFRDGTEAGDIRVENIQELFNVAVKFEHMAWQEGLTEFLEEVSLITDLDSVEDGKEAVTLMTLHAAKGLEFDTVFFVGLEEGLLPHSQSLLDPTQLAEEIRLAYVGLTRARNRLYLVYARTRRVFGSLQANSPSRILRVLPQEALEIHAPSSSFIDTGKSGITYEPADF